MNVTDFGAFAVNSSGNETLGPLAAQMTGTIEMLLPLVIMLAVILTVMGFAGSMVTTVFAGARDMRQDAAVARREGSKPLDHVEEPSSLVSSTSSDEEAGAAARGWGRLRGPRA